MRAKSGKPGCGYTRRTEIDWDEMFKWLEMGYLVQDLAGLVDLGRNYLSHRARKDLSPERWEQWNELARRNMGRFRSEANANRRPKCGTEEAWKHHHYRNEPPCRPCKDAVAGSVRLDNHERETMMTEEDIEYQVDRRWSKKWKREVFVVERRMGGKFRMVASYREAEVAREVASKLNGCLEFEN